MQTLPTAADWSELEATTAAEDQGQGGSCVPVPQVVEKFLGVVEVTFGELTFTRMVDQSDDLPVPEVMKLVEVVKGYSREHTSD